VGFGDFISSLSGLYSTTVSPTQSQQAAATKGDKDRAAIEGKNATLTRDFHGEYTPEGVESVMENFDGMSHDRILQFVNSIFPADLSSGSDAWTKLAEGTAQYAKAFKDNIDKEIGNGWAGTAATAAGNSVRTYVDDVDNLKDAGALVANKIDDASATLVQVKNQVPGKAARRSTSLLGIVTDVVVGPVSAVGEVMADHGRAGNAQNAARDVMKNVYATYLPESDRNVPRMPGPSQVTGNQDPGGDQPPGRDVPTGVPTIDPGGHTPGDNTQPPPGGTTNPNQNTNPSATTPTGVAPHDPSAGKPVGTTPSITTPSVPSVPSGTVPSTTTAGYNPDGPGGPGDPGSPGGPGDTPGGPGRSVPGRAPGGPGGTPAPGGLRAGQAGAPGMGGMMSPGGKGKGEDDEKEHKSADYLRGVQEELLGPDIKAIPPVIGGDYQGA
jgi:hypothetical protein